MYNNVYNFDYFQILQLADTLSTCRGAAFYMLCDYCRRHLLHPLLHHRSGDYICPRAWEEIHPPIPFIHELQSIPSIPGGDHCIATLFMFCPVDSAG